MSTWLKKVPLRQNYKEVEDEFVKLKAPPNISRGCFVFELSVAAAAFAVSFYISFTSTTPVTSITYEPLGSSYTCKVLSPRSDSVSFSSKSNELAQFSSSRFSYDGCIDALGTGGLDVCADGNRKDYLLALSVITASEGGTSDSSLCYDLLLSNGYRFCKGSLTEYLPGQTSSFPKALQPPSTAYSSGPFYYFLNADHNISAFADPFHSVLTDYLAYDDAVYVVAEDAQQRTHIYRFVVAAGSHTRSALNALEVVATLTEPIHTLTGFDVNNGAAYVLAVDQTLSMAYLSVVDLSTGVTTIKPLDCAALTDSEYYATDSSDTRSRYLSVSSDTAVAMCGKNLWNGAYTFYAVNTASLEAWQLHVDVDDIQLLGAAGNATQDNVTALTTVCAIDGDAYFSSGAPHYNLLRVDLAAQPSMAPSPPPTARPSANPSAQPTHPPGPPPGPLSVAAEAHRRVAVLDSASSPPVTPSSPSASPNWVMQPVQRLGRHSSASLLVRGWGQTVYFRTDNVPSLGYYNISSAAFETYESSAVLRDDAFYVVSTQVGYSFAICDGAVFNATDIDPEVSSSYHDACDSINGIYYQTHSYLANPVACAGAFISPGHGAITLAQAFACPELATAVRNFTATTCAASFEKICDASYTDNPPFSCTEDVRPDFLTTLGSALSNASALWSLVAVMISVTLRRVYPGGVLAREYDITTGEKSIGSRGGSGSSMKGMGRGAAVVYPVCEVAGGDPDQDMELGKVNGAGGVTTKPSGDKAVAGEGSAAETRAQQDQHEGCITTCLDDLALC